MRPMANRTFLAGIAKILVALALLALSCGRQAAPPKEDLIPPSVLAEYPTNLAVDVAVDAAVVVTFSEPMDESSVTSATLRIAGSGGGLVDGAIVMTDGTTATFRPKAPLEYGATYIVTVQAGVLDRSGNAMTAPHTFAFTTGRKFDTEPPTVAARKPDGTAAVGIHENVSVTFSERMDEATVTPASFVVTRQETPVSGTIVSYEGKTFVFTPEGETWDYSTTYVVVVDGSVADLAGNRLVDAEGVPAASSVWSFRTQDPAPDRTPPAVLSTIPADGAGNVSRNITSIVASFNETMLPDSLTAATYFLRERESGEPVACNVETSGATSVLRPQSPLKYLTEYLVTLTTGTTGVRDLAGNPLAVASGTEYRWAFRTEPIPRYLLTVGKTGDGNGDVAASAGSLDWNGDIATAAYDYEALVTLTAHAAAGSTFNGWSGEGCSGTGVCTVTMTGARNVTATFTLNEYRLTVAKSGNGNGVVTAGTGTLAWTGRNGEATFLYPTPVTLAAIASTGSTLSGWTGCDSIASDRCTVVMTADRTVDAAFTLNGYALTVLKTGTGNGTVTASAGTIDWNGTTGTAAYDYNTQVALTAVATAGSTFSGWSGEGCSGTGVCAVAMTAARNVTATFTMNSYVLTVATTGDGSGSVTAGTGTISWTGNAGTATYAYNTQVTLAAAAAAGSTFDGWTGAGCSGTGVCTVTMTAARNVTAAFTRNHYVLIVAKTGTGTGMVTAGTGTLAWTGSSGTASYDYNTQVTLTAAAATGSAFNGWSGEGCSGTGTCTLAMTAARNVTASFTLNSYVLTVAKTGTGSGTVTASAGTLAWTGTTGTATYDYNTQITLTAAAAAGSAFSGWTGEGCSGTGNCTVALTAARNVTASFSRNSYVLTIAKTGTGSGTVTANSGTLAWTGTTGTATYDYNAQVTLTAAAATGSTFSGWTGEGCTGTSVCTVAMTAARNVTASFTLNQYPVTVTKSGAGSGVVTPSIGTLTWNGTSGTAAYDYTTQVTLTAAASTGSTFSGWSGEGCSGTGGCTVNMTAARNVTASFTLNQYALTVTKAGSGSGDVTPIGGSLTWTGNAGTALYFYGTSVVLVPVPATGSSFGGWTGCDSIANNQCTVALTAAKSVTATFELNGYPLQVIRTGTGSGVVNVNTGALTWNGTTGTATYSYNTQVTLTAAALTGSGFAGWSGEGCSGTGTCVVTLSAARSVSAAFTLNNYVVTASAGTGGSISPASLQVNHGSTATFSVTANGGYSISSVTGCGGTLSGGQYTTGPITGTCTVTASFTPDPVAGVCGSANGGTFTTMPTMNLCSAGTAGTVSGAGPWSWTCTGLYGGATASCSANIQAYTVTASAGTGGTISPASRQVTYGSTTTFTVTANGGYSISSVTGCGGTLSGGQYTTGPITGTCAVTASFTPDPVAGVCGSANGGTFTTMPTTNLCSAGTAGTVSGAGPWAWTCAGLYGGTTASCSANIQAYTVTASAGTGGSISPVTQQTNYGAVAAMTATAEPGYFVASVSGCNGAPYANADTAVTAFEYQTGTIAAACEVTATFAQ